MNIGSFDTFFLMDFIVVAMGPCIVMWKVTSWTSSYLGTLINRCLGSGLLHLMHNIILTNIIPILD
jgi:hypothetical protein